MIAESDGALSLDMEARLRALLTSSVDVGSGLELKALLRRVVDAARQVVEAQYVALGLRGPDGSLVHFIHAGVDPELRDRLGRLPRGLGVLGLPLGDAGGAPGTDDARPIRLAALHAHPASVGLPDGHPPMGPFAGVPIRVHGAVLGSLYLANPPGGHEFNAADEELLTFLASIAAVGIENSRLYESLLRRHEWLEASRRVTDALLTPMDLPRALQFVAEAAQTAAAADGACVLLPCETRAALSVEAAAGLAVSLRGLQLTMDGSLVGRVLDDGVPALLDTADGPLLGTLEPEVPRGAVMVVPIGLPGGVTGALTLLRHRGVDPWDDEELRLAHGYAGQVALVVALTHARDDVRRLELLEDRTRIARDLHDHVIQRLFGVGLDLEALASESAGQRAAALLDAVEHIDQVIRDIRTTIFALRHASTRAGPGLRTRVIDLAAEMEPKLPSAPRVHFEGPVDTAVPPDVADDLLAVLREGLSNVARHAAAHEVDILLSVVDGIALRVTDDGGGLSGRPRGGLLNIADRARTRGGTCSVDSAPGLGTTIEWRVPLRPGGDR